MGGVTESIPTGTDGSLPESTSPSHGIEIPDINGSKSAFAGTMAAAVLLLGALIFTGFWLYRRGMMRRRRRQIRGPSSTSGFRITDLFGSGRRRDIGGLEAGARIYGNAFAENDSQDSLIDGRSGGGGGYSPLGVDGPPSPFSGKQQSGRQLDERRDEYSEGSQAVRGDGVNGAGERRGVGGRDSKFTESFE